jgi:hydroxyacylglutathione hydrolase
MNVYFHFSVAGFSNCYLIGAPTGGEAIIIDPGAINVPLIRTIEDKNYDVQTVLLTHRHESHKQGLSTLLKIYDAEVFSFGGASDGEDTQIFDDVVFTRGDVEIRPILIGGHSADSVAFLIDSVLYTGDVLGPGRVGSAPNAYAKALLIDAIKKRLFSLPGDLMVFPGHGAPTTLDAERLLNPFFT